MPRTAEDRTDTAQAAAAKAGDTPRGGIQALDAALGLLRAMAVFSRPVGLSELARAAAMPASKAHRYLASFVHAGLVVQSGRSGRYDLGPLAIELGLAAVNRNSFVNRTADRLEELSLATGFTALLTVWGSQGPTVVRWERTTSFTLTSLGLGSTLPLLTSASGRVFLAYMPERLTADRLRQEVQRARASGTRWPDLDPTPEGIAALVAQIRARRLAHVDGRLIPGLKAIAAPVTNWQGESEAAVTLVGTLDDRLEPDSAAAAQLLAFTDSLSIAPAATGS